MGQLIRMPAEPKCDIRPFFIKAFSGCGPLYQVSPPWAKRGANNYWCYWMLFSLSQLCLLSRLNSRNDLDLFKFARVRADDRERNFRDSPVPQPVVQKFHDGPDPKPEVSKSIE